MALRLVRLLLVFMLPVLTGCHSPPPSPTAGLPSMQGLQPDPAKLPQPMTEEAGPQAQISISQILVCYQGAKDVRVPGVLSRAQARVRAEALLLLARAKGQNFEDFANRFSNDRDSASQGGDLGVISKGQLHPDLERAAWGLGMGQVSDLIETPLGFHILLRHEPSEGQAADIVVSYTGAKRYTPRQARTREEAQRLAEQILARLKQGSSFEEEGRAFSDLPDADQGGIIPIFRRGRQNQQFEQVVWNLAPGEVSPVTETPTGFHLLKRLPVERIQIRQVVIRFYDDAEAGKGKGRGREEAWRLADETRRKALLPGADFAALAFQYSEAPENKRGGLLDLQGRGQLPHAQDRVVFALKPGRISEIVELQDGYVFSKRVR